MKAQRGFTMLEVSLVLALAFAIIAVGLGWYDSSRQSATVTKYKDQYWGVAGFVADRYPRGNYTGLSSTALTNDVNFPIAWRTAVGGAIIHPEGGTIVLSSTALTDRGQAANTAFQLQYSLVQSKTCIDFVMALANSVPQITVASTVVKSRTVNGGVIDRDTAITQCNSSPAGVTIQVVSEG